MTKTAREYLAENLARLMKERKLSTGRLAVEGLVDQKTVWRMANATNETGTDKLDAVARKIGGIEAWQLLAPNLGRRSLAVEEVSRRLEELGHEPEPGIPADMEDLVRRIASAPDRAKAIRAAQQAVIRLLEPAPPEPPAGRRVPAAPAPSASAPANPPPKPKRTRSR